MSEIPFNSEYELSKLVDFVTEKINVAEVSFENYISTDNMLVDRGGVEHAIKLPKSSTFNCFKSSDTLFSNIRTYFRKVWMADFSGGASPDVLIFRTKNSEILDSTYLYYILSNEDFMNYTVLTAKGAKMPRGDKAAIMQYKVKLPSIDEQRKIGQQLLNIDKKIGLNRQANQTLEQIVQALFKSWFVDFDPVRAKIHAKQNKQDPELAVMCAISGKTEQQFESWLKDTAKEDEIKQLTAIAALFPDELVESELGEMPKGWGVVRFKNIVDKYIDNRGKTPPTKDRGIPLLEVKHLPDNSIKPNTSTEKFVDAEIYNTWFRAHLEENDIIISTVGTIGRICLVPNGEVMAIAQNLLGIRFNGEKALPYFMFYQMNGYRFKHDVDARLVITVQASIKRKDLETIDLLLPPIGLQKYFQDLVQPFVEMQQSGQGIGLAKVRDTIQPKLLSGEIEI